MKFPPPLLLLTAAAAAQGTWLPQSPPVQPSQRYDHGLVYDPTTQRTFLFFGLNFGDPWWTWDGAAWSQPTVSYSGLFWNLGRGGICADGAGGILLFGGFRPGIGIGGGTPTVLDQTWQVTIGGGTTLQFIQLAPATFPGARQGTRMVRTNQGVLLFGGENVNSTVHYGDTWRWNGATWTQVSSPLSPAPRSYHAMAFDAARNVVVLFGGATSTATTVDDTWEFDGAAWHQESPAHRPSPRCKAACVYAPAAGRTLLFGGGAFNGTGNSAELWAWDGTDWRSLPTSGTAPTARQGAAFAYDEVRQQTLLFGGIGPLPLDETWYLDVQIPPSTYTPFGAGCVGPNGLVPVLSAVPAEVPAIGTTSHLEVTNLGPGLSLPVFILGTSNTFEPTPPSHPLPFDLGFLGWPGCQQLVSHEVFEPMPTLTGAATLAFAVPPTPSLIGFTFHAQVLALYVPGGAAVSNALTGVVGL